MANDRRRIPGPPVAQQRSSGLGENPSIFCTYTSTFRSRGVLEHENQDGYMSHFDEGSVQFNRVSTVASAIRQQLCPVFRQIARLPDGNMSCFRGGTKRYLKKKTRFAKLQYKHFLSRDITRTSQSRIQTQASRQDRINFVHISDKNTLNCCEDSSFRPCLQLVNFFLLSK